MTRALLDRPAPPVDDATRRQFLIGGMSAAALLAGCSRPDADPPAPSGAGNGGFPVTIEHQALLSGIAPTIPSAGQSDYGMPWQEETRLIARALGRQQRAEELIAGVETRFAEARARHPEFAGARALIPRGAAPEGVIYTYRPEAPNVRVLTALGFEIPTAVFDGLSTGGVYATFSVERLGLLDDVDVVVQLLGRSYTVADIEAIPGYSQLRVNREGRIVFVTDHDFNVALNFATVLSLPFALQRLEPMLTAAVDGDPATSVPN